MTEALTIADLLKASPPLLERPSLFLPDLYDRTVTYKELNSLVKDLQNAFHAAGLRSQHTLSLVFPNGLSCLISFLAVTGMGAIAAPLNFAYKADEFLFYLKDTESKAVVLPADVNKDHEAIKAAHELNIPVWFLEEGKEGNLRLDLSSRPLAESQVQAVLSTPKADDIALFLHTSGTTSLPKGVPLTHRNIMTSIGNISKIYELSPDDVSLIVMPLFHVHGLIGATLSTLLTGGSLVIPAKFSASTFWKHVAAYNVTWYSAVPTIHQILLLRADEDGALVGKFRFIRSCSSSLAPVLFEKLQSRFGAPVLEAYGMTEACHQMATNPLPSNGKSKIGSVGLPANVEISIRDDNDQALAPNERGEVCIRGQNVTSGYHNRPEANVTAFTPTKWFRTGDQGYLDDDGYLFLTGRIKEMINRAGEKISPLEIDALLLAHPSVKDAVSFSAPHPIYGEEVACAVVPRDGHQLTAEDIVSFCKPRTAPFKVPTKIFVTAEFPRTATGKIQRRHVASHFLKSD